MYQKNPLVSHCMNWTCLQVLWRMVCHMCHTCVTCPRLLGYPEVCATATATTNIFFLQEQLLPRALQEQFPREVFCSGECGASQPWWATAPWHNPGSAHTTDSLSLLLHKHHQLLAQTFRRNIKNCSHGEVQKAGAVKHWRWPSPPLGSSCWHRGWGKGMIKEQHCCCPSCKVVNPWRETQPNPRAWKPKTGITLSLHWNQAYHRRTSPLSSCSCRRCFVLGLFFPCTACIKSLSLD